ncbi:DUF342 domain-containing protein [Roseateles oligotrophus]|uniref:FapA family protein n=1 Tax=Roseateles oligotrophus TaxID=1769250 RepID=A0ABT2YD40_9BURK|nr:FapA family protein [Roseateles oligotrophus]MCV2367971.1 FapA family protein [Roseateles oligotrophus]
MLAPIPGLELFESDAALRLRCQAVAGRPALDAASLLALIAEVGAGNWRLDDATLALALTRCNTEPEPVEMQLALRSPAKILVEIAADEMSASVTLEPSDSGLPIQLDALMSELASAGVTHGIDESALAEACRATSAQQLVAAVGRAPVRGADASFELLIEDHRERAPKVNAQGMVDFREHGEVPVVSPGQLLMRRTPASAGEAGVNVRGQALPAEPGLDEPFTMPLLGAALDPSDANLLRATAKGQPVRLGNAVSVEQLFQVSGVNMASGNVNFDGTVQIDGDVVAGMKVTATGDILVQGTVEGGILEAGGDIRIQGGAIARASLQAGASVEVRFVENSTVHAALAIVIDDSALHSELQAGAQISVGEKSRQRGRLAGGSARAKMRIKVPTLGASAGGRTRLQVGLDPELEDKLADLVQLAAKQKAEAEKFELLVQFLSKNGDPKGMLAKARPAWQEALRVWAMSLQEKDAVEHQLADVKEARIDVSVGVEGDVDLVIGRKLCHLKHKYVTGSFSMQDTVSMIYTDANGGVHPLA